MLYYNYKDQEEDDRRDELESLVKTDNKYIVISGMISFLREKGFSTSDVNRHILNEISDNSKKWHIRKLIADISTEVIYNSQAPSSPTENPFVSRDDNSYDRNAKKTYIIKDNNTGFYKIGRSSNPLKREKTLQSEKPTYKLLKVWEQDIERILHFKYKDQRVRGEWFDLTKVQVKYICTHY